MRRARASHSKLLGLRWLANREGKLRVGIVVSRKVGNAVVRNRIRRRLREALRAIARDMTDERLNPAATYKKQASFDLLVMTRPEAAEADYGQLKRALYGTLKKGKLIT